MSVGENIRETRESQSMTQAQLAEMVSISQAILCQIERGTKNPSLQVGNEIALALGVDLGDLIRMKKSYGA